MRAERGQNQRRFQVSPVDVSLIHSEGQEILEHSIVLVVDVKEQDRSRECKSRKHLQGDRYEMEIFLEVKAGDKGRVTAGIPVVEVGSELNKLGMLEMSTLTRPRKTPMTT